MKELPEVMFPSVTVCNFNVVKLSALKDTKFSNLMDLEDGSEKGSSNHLNFYNQNKTFNINYFDI